VAAAVVYTPFIHPFAVIDVGTVNALISIVTGGLEVEAENIETV
jgi:hypothetical protein